MELSFTTAFIEANSSVSLKITWTPTKSGHNREILQLTDSCGRFYDILLLMDAKVPRKNTQKSLITPSRNVFDPQNESSFKKTPVQSRNKRTRIDFDQVDPNKENFTHLEHDPFTEKAIKKSRKEIFSFEETLRRDTKQKGVSNFSLTISNINFTPKISSSPDEVFEFSHRGISAWSKSKKRMSNYGADFVSSTPCRRVISSLKPSKLVQNFDILNPATPALFSLDCSNLETSKKISNASSRNFESSRAKEVQKVSLSKHRQSKQLGKALKKKTLSIPGGRIANRSLAVNRKKANQSLKNEKKSNLELHEPSDLMIKSVHPDPFAATITEDPFLSCTLKYDEKWVFLQEVAFKKWLNTLMTAPEHLTIDMDSTAVDVGKVWQSCRMKEEGVLAESKESISARYHTNTRLNTLRKAASVMFRKDEVREAIAGATHCIENGSLVFKKDKDPYRDIGLQKEILELFLSYNPLWLRIGLETVYGETIPLQSNNDLVGLTRFLLARFFSDPTILKKHSHPTVAGMKLPTFTSHMNNFMLKKLLQVVYFLDYAKMNKLIGHDPCLFRKTAPHKESRSILLTFSREVLSGIGDITKVLRLARYVVYYKQTYLDEFDYAVNDMSLDLRDGVRLCRTMELIRGKGNLTSYCRVPAVSKLQKIHNVNIALTALLDSGYFLIGQIDAKSIVNGDREKTLSLLWQIIFKFQAPRFEKAATSLQTWWRSKLWYVHVKNFLKKRRSNAASVIQKAWRCYSAKKELNQLREENRKHRDLRNKAARKIQEWWIFRREGLRERNTYLETKSAVPKIQRWWRRCRETRPFVQNLRRKREALVLIQRVWRARKLIQQKKLECLKLNASRVIQKWWRRVLILKRDRNHFLLMKHAVWVLEKNWIEKKMIKEEMKRKNCLKIQNWWRYLQETKAIQARYSRMKKAALMIQKNWRMVKAMRNYLRIKSAVLRIESWYEGLIISRSVRQEFLKKKNSVRKIENWWEKFLERKSAAVKIQSWFRMIEQKREFKNVLKHHKAAVVMQSRWRAILDNRKVETKSAISIQKHWRCYLARKDYKIKREAAIQIQDWWREVLKNKQLEVEKKLEFRRTENVVVKILPDYSDKMRKRSIEQETLTTILQKSINSFLFSNDLGRLSMCLASLGEFEHLFCI